MTSRSLRIATWNVHGLQAGVEAVASAVRAQELDVLMVQESGPRRRLRALAEDLHMSASADPRAFPRRRIQNAVLVRGGGATIAHHDLRRFSRGTFVHPRGALVADLDERLSVISVHLGLRGPERGRHIGQLLEITEGSAGRCVIGGDLNASPGDPGPMAIASRMSDVWDAVGEGDGFTFPSDAPVVRIDYLFTGPAVQPLRAWTAGGTVSDHLMVVADVRVVPSCEAGETRAPGSGRTGRP